MNNTKKVVIIGLDCATPKTLFENFLNVCPNIRRLMEHGIYGRLRSSDPPITIPAWMVMSTGKKAGTLGVYGFRNRKDRSYKEYWIANSNTINEPKIWEIIAEKGLKSCILGVVPTYPVKPINGCLVSGFITPDTNCEYTFPSELKEEIKSNIGDYILDVEFRTDAKKELLNNIYKMTKVQFQTIKYLMLKKEWDYFHFVIIGLDRFHHAFWKYFDKSHPKYKSGNEFESEAKNYYAYLDNEIGDIIKLINDDTIVLIVSDHGAKAMKGCLCINEALEKLGLLKFKIKPKPGTPFEEADIDWKKTYAWGWGGYYARIFLNLEGREKEGIIKEKNFEKMRDKIAEKIRSIKDDKGNNMDTKVYKPEALYQNLNGDVPDLMVYLDDLNWRSAGTVGYDSMYLYDNDIGPDDAVHDYYGIFIIYDPTKKIGKEVGDKNILDIAPTILNIFGIQPPDDMEGNIIKF